MNAENPRRTWDREGKSKAVVDVLSHVMSSGPEVGQNCVDDDAYARGLFDDPEMGNVDVPDNVQVAFVPIGDRAKEDKGSIVIELPPSASNQVNPKELQKLIDYGDGISLTSPRTWDKRGKPLAILAFLDHVMKYPKTGERCLRDASYVRWLFQHADIGNTQVPEDIKIVIVPARWRAGNLGRSSLKRLHPVPSQDHRPPAPPILSSITCFAVTICGVS